MNFSGKHGNCEVATVGGSERRRAMGCRCVSGCGFEGLGLRKLLGRAAWYVRSDETPLHF